MIKPKKTKFNTLIGIAMNKIENSVDCKCTVEGGVMKMHSLDGTKYSKVEKLIKEIIEYIFNRKASKICKLNYFDSNLYLCFKKVS